MNKLQRQEGELIIGKAERTIRIVRNLMAGKSVVEVAALEHPADRTLVNYYHKLLNK